MNDDDNDKAQYQEIWSEGTLLQRPAHWIKMLFSNKMLTPSEKMDVTDNGVLCSDIYTTNIRSK